MTLGLYEIAELVGAKNDVHVYPDSLVLKAEFDSRKIGAGDLFVPLQGARDGHDFIATAFDQGAAVTLSERPVDYPHILVEDCLLALQTLAKAYLQKTGVEVIAVTGSNGKTTTKDMIHDVLATSFKTYKTQGNYNNEIGLPYTILQMPAGTEKLVLEMGQDHLGDIELLSKLAQPSLSVITLFGEAHLAYFDSREQIAEGKLQIAAGMQPGSCLLLPEDPVAAAFLPTDLDLVFFGENGQIGLTQLVEEKTSLRFSVNFMDRELTLPVTGKYNAINAMLAAYVGKKLGVSDQHIQKALGQIQLTANRTQWKKAANGADILSDVYNANPTAVRLIVETFATIPRNPRGKKILVLADMKELGEESLSLHRQLVDCLLAKELDVFFFYGQDIEGLSQLLAQKRPNNPSFFFRKDEEVDQMENLLSSLQNLLEPQDQLLLKGSNSMGLAALLEQLETAPL